MGANLYNQIMKILKEHECENYVLLVKDPDKPDDSQHWGNENWAEGAMLQAIRQIKKNQDEYIIEPDDGEERTNAKD